MAMPHQLLLLLSLLLLIFIVSLPTCQSRCDISAARRDSQTGAGSHKLSLDSRTLKNIARRAARKANVKLHGVEEAYAQVFSCFFLSFFAVLFLVLNRLCCSAFSDKTIDRPTQPFIPPGSVN